jgi:capsid protein
VVALIEAGLMSAQSERMVAGGRPMEVTRVRMTEAPAVARGASLRL